MSFVSVKTRGLVARLGALRTRHARLEGAIKAEQKRPLACTFKLQSLKRLRLKVKDEIQALRSRAGGRSLA